MFAFKISSYESVRLMKHEANAPTTYEDVVREIGAPDKIATDNAQFLTCVRWNKINRKYCIYTGLTFHTINIRTMLKSMVETLSVRY